MIGRSTPAVAMLCANSDECDKQTLIASVGMHTIS